MKRALFHLATAMAAVILGASVSAQQVGPNVNVLSGTDPRTGDAFLQRQNEPTLAVSTRNADHLIVAMNDYRTVDIAADLTTPGASTGNGLIARALQKLGLLRAEQVRAQTVSPEAWIGLAATRDRGRTWYNFMLPGYPQDPTAVGQASPVYGDTAGSDPVFITGTNGRVYLIALTFDRNGISRMSGTRYTDANNIEGAAPWRYDFTRQIDKGSISAKGVFVDKPSAASSVAGTVGVSKKRKPEVVVAGCERLYVAFTRFDGNDSSGNFQSSVYVSTSASCADAWSAPVKVSGPFSVAGLTYPGTRNQGTAMAVDPDTGAVYVLWRTYKPDGFVVVRSTDGGVTFSAPAPILQPPMYLYDQPLLATTAGTNAVTFRANDFPSLMVYDGRLVAVWSEKVDATTGSPAANGVPRIVMSVGTPNTGGTLTWAPRSAIDLKDPGAAANTRCEQVTPGGSPVCRPTGAQLMPFATGRNGQVAVVYYEARDAADAPGGIAPGTGYISGIQRQVDLRAVVIDPSTWQSATAFQISRYQVDPATGHIKEAGRPVLPAELQKQVNYANYPMYRGGIAAFIGDYVHGMPLRPDGMSPGFRFVFTSNEFVVPPDDLDFTKYGGPFTGLPSACNPGSRNSTIMSAEVGTGLVLGSPGTFKQLVGGNGQPIQRAFAVYLENHTIADRAFHLALTPSAGVQASFDQFDPTQAQVDVEVLPSSSVTRTVYLTGTGATGSAVVTASEFQVTAADARGFVTGLPFLGLAASLTLNGDASNPAVGGSGGNPGLADAETHAPQVGSPQVGSPQVGSPQVGSPQVASPQVGSPQVGSPQVSSPQVGSTGLTDPTYTDVTFKVTNGGNTASAFNTLVSLALQNLPGNFAGHHYQVLVYRVNRTAAPSGCGIGQAQVDQVLYMTPGAPQVGSPQVGSPQVGSPQVGSPQVGSPQVGSPQVGSPQVGSPQVASTSFAIAPADPTTQSASAALAPMTLTSAPATTTVGGDGTERQQQPNDSVLLTLRIIHPPTEADVAAAHGGDLTAFYQAVLGATGVAVQAQAVDTVNVGTNNQVPDSTFVDLVPPDTSVPLPSVVTSAQAQSFTFTGTDNLTAASALKFECSFDQSPWQPCTSPQTYANQVATLPATHTFSVRAIDQANNVDPTPATVTWTIVDATSLTIPDTAAAGFGQLVTVRAAGAPSTASTCNAVFTQGGSTVEGFCFLGASKQGEYFVRLPFVGDNFQNGSLAPGAATVTIALDRGLPSAWTSGNAWLNVSTTPGTPQARFAFTPGPSSTPTTTIVPGQTIAIAGYGVDTIGASATFTQNGNSVTVPSTNAESGTDIGVAPLFTVPATLSPGLVTVQVTTTVNGVESARSNALALGVPGQALLNFSPAVDQGGDFIDRGFYVPSYPGSALSAVTVWLTTPAAGTYTVSMIARAGTYDGPTLGTSTTTVTLPQSPTSTPVTFYFPLANVAPGTLVTFAMSQVSPAGLQLYYNIYGQCGPSDPNAANCAVANTTVETEGTTPPLDTVRRNGVSVRIEGKQ